MQNKNSETKIYVIYFCFKRLPLLEGSFSGHFYIVKSYLLFVTFCTPAHVEAWKSLEVHQQIVLRRNSVIYIAENLLFGRVNLVLGYGLFGIFNQQSSHNIRKCFHILWLDKLHSMQSLWLSLWKIVRRLEKKFASVASGASQCMQCTDLNV